MAEIFTNDNCRISYKETGSGPTLLFVHGWAMSNRVWQYQQEEFATTNRVIALDLRGHGLSDTHESGPTMDDFATDIETILTALDLREVTIVAWSMGVSATLRAFSRIRDRLAGVVFVGGTPHFTADDDFPHGLPSEEIRGMALRLRRNYARTMEEFFRGMFTSSEADDNQYRQIVRDIVKGGNLPEQQVALASLESLASADFRHLTQGVTIPTLLIHGSDDLICPPEASSYMAGKIAGARLTLLPGLGHAPFLSRPEEFNRLLREHLRITPSINLVHHKSPDTSHHSPSPGIDRRRVRNSFHLHADEYESHARVQRRIVQRIMASLNVEDNQPTSVLDVGCGTGMLLSSVGQRFPSAKLTGIDLAPGMVAATKEALGSRQAEVLIADAEHLPFGGELFDLILSTSTFQWLEHLQGAFGEVYRTLTPGGSFRFALFGAGTLRELKDSYRTALTHHNRLESDRTHRFLTKSEVEEQLTVAGFRGIKVWNEDETEYHTSVRILLRSLKKIGAGNAAHRRDEGLSERGTMVTMMRTYEGRYGGKEGIPATYEVIYGECCKN